MQRSSDQAAVCRMQENSSDQWVTLKVVMGLPLPNRTTENREVLFHSISSSTVAVEEVTESGFFAILK